MALNRQRTGNVVWARGIDYGHKLDPTRPLLPQSKLSNNKRSRSANQFNESCSTIPGGGGPLSVPLPPANPIETDEEAPDQAGQRSRPAKKAGHIVAILIAWPLLIGVAMVLYLRTQPVDDPLMIAVVGLTPLVGLPLIVAIVIAVFSRSLTLRAATAGVAAAFMMIISPVDAVIGCGASVSEASVAGETATVLTANVLVGGALPEEFIGTVTAVDPDIIVMQELRGDFLDPLRADERMSSYQWRTEDWPGTRRGTVVWSRWPMTAVEPTPNDVESTVKATIDTPFGELDVLGVHLTAPAVAANVEPWKQDLAGLSAQPTDGTALIAGDFNATEDHEPFRLLLQQGWSDAHDNKGCGLDATWPSGGLPTAVMRLDHILVTDQLTTHALEVLPAGGSDHHPVVAVVGPAD